MHGPAPVSTLDEVRGLMARLPGPDRAAEARAAEREARLTKPAGALGRLEQISAWAATWQGRHPPRVDDVLACVFAGNHGVAARGVSAYPAEVTAQMVANFETGGAAINQICAAVGARLKVLPLALDAPTADFTAGPAMSDGECAAAFAAGMETVEDGVDLLCLGEMGIANTTAAAALACALFGGEAEDWAGPGTGVDEAGLGRKTAAIELAMATHGDALADPFEALRRVGGRELAAIAGAVLAARLGRVPVLLDGYVCTAAAAVLESAAPGALDHCLVAHLSAEPGHRRLAESLGKRPLFDLAMRLGEGTGAALAAAAVRAAVAAHTGMATFGEAGVSEKGD
ncbi:MAG: nicotinate-nucleotide--dimethylbenzimidazole phosphoribosyltransferase [Alphaproteobacteria bacterium]